MAFVARPRFGDLSWSTRAGCAGLYILLLFFQLNATVAFVGLVLTLLAFVAESRHWWPRLKEEPAALLFLAIMVYVAFSAAWAAWELPDTRSEQWKSVKNWLECLLFIPVAWFAARRLHRVDGLLLLFAAGVLLRILIHTRWSHLDRFFAWERTGFGLNPIAMGLYAGIVLLGLMVLGPRLLAKQEGSYRRSLIFCLFALALLIFFEAFFLSQSRGAWLAAALVFPPVVVVRYWEWLRHHAFRSAKGLITLIALTALIAALFGQNAEFIQRRVQDNPQAATSALPPGEDHSAAASTGYRLALWKLGFRQWMERPWLGWGAGSTEYVIEQAKEPAVTDATGKAMFSHLHNLYLEILLRFGLLGALLFAALLAALLLGVRNAYREEGLSRDHYWLLLGVWGYSAIWSFFDFRFFHHEWRNYCVILAALTCAWQWRLRDGRFS